MLFYSKLARGSKSVSVLGHLRKFVLTVLHHKHGQHLRVFAVTHSTLLPHVSVLIKLLGLHAAAARTVVHVMCLVHHRLGSLTSLLDLIYNHFEVIDDLLEE